MLLDQKFYADSESDSNRSKKPYFDLLYPSFR